VRSAPLEGSKHPHLRGGASNDQKCRKDKARSTRKILQGEALGNEMDGDGDDIETSCGDMGGDGDLSSGDGRDGYKYLSPCSSLLSRLRQGH